MGQLYELYKSDRKVLYDINLYEDRK